MSHVLIALTFDGGPDGIPRDSDPAKPYNTTERVLSVLKAPPLEGVRDVKAAFFVQTHVKGRMAAADGADGAGASHGRELVKAIVREGHVVGVLNGGDADFERHVDQLAGGTLLGNLNRATAELATLLPPSNGAPTYPQFTRAPFGLHDGSCEKVYAQTSRPLEHAHWDCQAVDLPLGDLCPGVSMATKLATLRRAIRAARKAVRRRLAKDKTPITVVVRLHDVSAVTASQLPQIMSTLAGVAAAEPDVPVRFCATTEEVERALRAAHKPDLERPHWGLPDAGKHPYDVRRRLATAYGLSGDAVLRVWNCIKTEWWVHHLYLDSESLPTVGVGSLVQSKAKLERVDLRDAAGAPVTLQQKTEKRDLLVKKAAKLPRSLRRRLGACLAISEYLVPDGSTLALLKEEVDHHLADLATVLAEFRLPPQERVPSPVALALFDMIYNMGKGSRKRGLRSFRRMFAAIKARNWITAANECRRNRARETEPGHAGIRERNDATSDLFRAMAVLTTEMPHHSWS